MPKSRVVSLAVIPLALATVLALAGCGTPPWEEAGQSASPSAAASASPTATPSPTPTKVKIRNDLSKGSIHKTLSAGAIKLTTTYYSTLDLTAWTPVATKPLTVSMTGSFDGGYKQDIFLSKTTVRIDAVAEDGVPTSLEPLVDAAPVTPGYLIKDPNSYGQVFTLPAMPDTTRSVTLNFTYELLAPAAPKSKRYTRQTAGDTIVIALATT